MEKLRLGLVSLGCPKNLVDTEVLLGKAAEQDYVVCGDPSDADIVVVNTCGFIDQARDESLDVISEMARWKKEGRIQKVVVTGCMAQRYGDEIRQHVPDVDSIIGMTEYDKFTDVLDGLSAAPRGGGGDEDDALEPWRTLVGEDASYPISAQTGRMRVTPRHTAYLKISEGCSNACTFCAIPNFRGLFRSKAWDDVINEARELVAAGARELNIISQDTTDYGRDLEGKGAAGLGALLDELAKIEDLNWIRILYAYPGHISDAMLDAIANNPKVVPYIDMPIQHINSRMLKRMGRRHTREETCELLAKMRVRMPDLVLRTTFIVGFPGETEEEFEELLEFIEDFEFERLGVFPYSHEPGTPAGDRFEDDVPDAVKQRRVAEAMALQQEIAAEWSEAQVGELLPAVIEQAVVDRDGELVPGQYVGRTIYDAPDIDGIIELRGEPGLPVGTFVQAAITGAAGYDLEGEILGAEPLAEDHESAAGCDGSFAV